MLRGFTGHLLAQDLLEDVLPSQDAPERHLIRRRLLDWRAGCLELGPASSLRALFDVGTAPLLTVLGFEPPRATRNLDEAITATLSTATHTIASLTLGWNNPIDAFWKVAVTEAQAAGAAWCLVFNGPHVRVVDANRVYARRYAQFDVDLALEHDETCAAFWLVLRASTLAGGARPPDTGLHALVRDSDRHATAVCRLLREGVLAAAKEMTVALCGPRHLAADPTQLDRAFEQSLTIVYRLLFLLFAEARGLLPIWHPIYRASYSMEALCTLASRPQAARGLWHAIQALVRLAHSGCHAGDLRVTPFNGPLFAPARTPLAERRHVDDGAARRTVLALATQPVPHQAGRRRISYRDLGVEQLGAVYESLLDYRPRLGVDGVQLGAGSHLRKATGTFYTPQTIADYIVRRTLGPLVRDATPDRILGLRIVDPAMGSGAFLVAACRYLADEYELALVRSGGCRAGDIDESERAAIRRTIAERCLYGVDLNPMAAQLARLSLWLTTLAVDRPLTFLDHRLQVGDSLVGAWLSNLRRPPTAARRRASHRPGGTLFEEDAVRGALEAALPMRFTLEREPCNSIEQVRRKERALAQLRHRDHLLQRWRRVADLWCASWFSPLAVPAAAVAALTDLLLKGHGALPASSAMEYLRRGAAVAELCRFFHWEIEFPEVFFDPSGQRLAMPGFDAVIGNPPWDMVRADSGNRDERARAKKRTSALIRFARDTGIYSAAGRGHPNRYQLFTERAIDLTRPGGRIGLVLPFSLAIDHGSADLRRRLFSRCDVDALASIDNRDGVFPIHRSLRFLLLTASAGHSTRSISCRFGERNPAALAPGSDQESPFPVRLSIALLRSISGDGLAIPDLRSPTDVAIAERSAALFPPLGAAHGWGVRFGRELNATEDRHHFGPPGFGLPIVEGKQIEPFHVALDASPASVKPASAALAMGRRSFERARLAYRDVAASTNRLTLIAAVLPRGCVTTHTVFCLRTPLTLARQHILCGLFNSLVVNYLVRLRVATHVSAAIVHALPIPSFADHPAALARIGALARLLARGPHEGAFCRLQAETAALYQLSETELMHLLDTFPLVEKGIRDHVLKTFTRETQR